MKYNTLLIIALNPTHIVTTDFHVNIIYSVIHMDVNYDPPTQGGGGGEFLCKGR